MNNKPTAVTKTLIDKFNENPDALTEDEKSAVSQYNKMREYYNSNLERANNRIVETCKMLCSSHEQLPVPDYGWIEPVEKLCYKLEYINVNMKKYGIQVVLDQSKEKYGTLRFYTHTLTKEIGILEGIIRFFDWISDSLLDIDYGIEYVTDRESYKSLEWKEITKEQFDNRTDEYNLPFLGKPPCVLKSKSEAVSDGLETGATYLVEEDGKYFYSYVITHMAKLHPEYRKHKFLRKIKTASCRISLWLSGFYKEPIRQRLMHEVAENAVRELVMNAERECYWVCQHCGVHIYDEGGEYQRCETQGWYTYVCERCATALGVDYRKGGKIYREGMLLPNDSKGDAVGEASNEG